MKKIFIILIILVSPVLAMAQNVENLSMDKEVFNIVATIFVVALFMAFILAVIKKILEYRLKNTLMEKGFVHAAANILETKPNEEINSNIKWFSILAGIGTGLLIVDYTLPLGLHSLAIMAFSIALSFLGYFFFLKLQTDKN